MNKTGINMGPPLKGTITITPIEKGHHDVGKTNNEKITKVMRYYNGLANKPKFLLIVLPFNDATMYATIKTLADTKAGIHIVYVVASKFA
jgi:hypothetical protein